MVLGHVPVPFLASMTARAAGNGFPNTTYNFLQEEE